MSQGWTVVLAPDEAVNSYRIRIAPEFHDGEGLTLATSCSAAEEAAGLRNG
jgi:hypothetical protein